MGRKKWVYWIQVLSPSPLFLAGPNFDLLFYSIFFSNKYFKLAFNISAFAFKALKLALLFIFLYY